MKVRELIDALGRFDPDDEVYTLDVCPCCTHVTEFRAVDAACVGRREIGEAVHGTFEPRAASNYPRQIDMQQRLADNRKSPRSNPIPKPPEVWENPGVVIAGSRWVYYPRVGISGEDWVYFADDDPTPNPGGSP